MKRKRSARRRATILVMVVSVLALLFVIVSGFLALARFERDNLKLAQQGATTDRILDNINEYTLSLMREQWADAQGDLLTGKSPASDSYEDIPGYRKAYWQAAPEVVKDAAVAQSAHALRKYRWPAVSLLADPGPAVPPAQRHPDMMSLMLESDRDGDQQINFNLSDPTNDIARNARIGFMDADADGVPDGLLMASWDSDGDGILDRELSGGVIVTELANLLGGSPVRLRGSFVDPNAIPQDPTPPPEYADDFWRRYNELARYEVAVRMVPHGGMVALSSPGEYGYGGLWNREFVTRTFNWIAKGPNALGYDDDALLNAVHASAAEIEPYLRRRGGALPSYRDDNGRDEFGRVPAALRDLEYRFRSTFVSQYERGREGNENWQRFNLSDTYQLDRWQSAVQLDPFAYNHQNPQVRANALSQYDRRHLITANSFSDELARKQTTRATSAAPLVGTYQGQTKFYLGDVEKCFGPDPDFNSGLADYQFNPGVAGPIIGRLADMFYDMLAGHSFTAANEQYLHRDQAYMLAVNTAAFAAPRDPAGTGFIDVVTHTDLGKIFVGYAPQPFITQVIVYDSDDSDDDDIAVAVELYNPNDRWASSGVDQHALFLPQFAISINTGLPPAPLDVSFVTGLGTPPRLEGRRFMSVAFHANGGNRYFENNSGAIGNPPGSGFNGAHVNYPVSLASGKVTVKLWRGDSAAPPNWYVVDQVEVDTSSLTKDENWYVDVWRDTNTDTYWGIEGTDAYARPRAARWRMMLDYPTGDPSYNTVYGSVKRETQSPSGRLINLGVYGPQEDPLGTFPRFGPTVPLHTMNAYTATVAQNNGFDPRTWIHGADRPNSFPTVGFMLFVPRFSHLKVAGTGVPITEVLGKVWTKQSSAYGFGLTNYPVDFGHMAVFDNQQGASASGAFAGGQAGRTPWGLLVFDYFTTLDPDGADRVAGTADDIDLYRVPGRINVNAAPWYVLAGLPVIGPQNDLDADGLGDLPLHPSASAAFRLTSSGTLVGIGVGPDFTPGTGDDMPRSLAYTTSMYPTTPLVLDLDGSWWRVGEHLAVSAAEYRDRIAYHDPTVPNNWYKGAFRRNDPSQPNGYRNEPRYGSVRRGLGTGASPSKYGLLSLGELANAKGFDGATYDSADVPVLVPLAQPGMNPVGGDFMRATSTLALLDTHFLTTRGNTFTVYVTVRDRVEAGRSVRSQITVDRSNMLPRLVLDVYDADGDYDHDEALLEDTDGDGFVDSPVVITSDKLPTVIAERRGSYYNARFDD